MHGYIYEIRSKRIEREEWANELTFSEDPNIDYARDLDDTERLAALKRLLDSPLISELFETTSEPDVLVLKNADVEGIKRKWYDAIQEDLDDMRKGKKIDTCRLCNTIDSPLGGVERYYLPEWSGDNSEPGKELLWFASIQTPGDRFYVGGVLDYHW